MKLSFYKISVFALGVALSLLWENSPSSAQQAANTLPTGGTVTSGSAIIAQNNNTLNINQSSQKAIINWSTFNVGSAATVNFNQPNSQSSTLNRVNSASKSMIDGAVNANGTVIFVNPNGIVFGKGAQVNTGSIVATTMNITDQEYLLENNKKIFQGSANGKIVNKGTITANNSDGYIALMAPQVKNQGVIIATMSGNNSIALVSGEKVTLTFQGEQLLNVNVDASTIKSLIKNKNLIQTNGGQVIIAANAASDLRSSVLVNTGTVSADGLNVKGGKVYLTASTIKQQGTVTASATSNSSGTRVEGGMIVALANTIKLASASKTLATGDNGGGVITLSAAKKVNVKAGALVDASANTSGNGGSINIDAPTVKVNGKLLANGGNQYGNGGSINIIASDFVTSASAIIKAGSQVANGIAGNLTISMPTININQVFANLISSALNSTNVILNALKNVYFTLVNSAINNAAIINLLQGVVIYKTTSNRTGLQFNADGTVYIAGQVVANEGSLLDLVLNGNNEVSISELAKLIASSVTINSKQGEVNLSGTSLTSAGGNINILAKGDINVVNLNVVANNPIDGGQIAMISTDGSVNLQQSFIQTNGGVGRGGTISITANQDVAFLNTNVLANGGTDGGQVVIISTNKDVNLSQTIIQTNGSTGRGGTILISGANQTIISGTEINATGYSHGGIIKVGYDALNQSIPFSNITSLDETTNLNASQQDTNSSNQNGGFIETSGKILNTSATVNAGAGGAWLLDPYNITIAGSGASGTSYAETFTAEQTSIILASSINASLNAGTSVTISTGGATPGGDSGDITVSAAITKTAGGNATLTLSAYRNVTLSSTISSTVGTLGVTITSTTGAFSGTGNLTLLGGALSITQAISGTYSGIISGGGALTKAGVGTLTLSNANTYSGATTISAGTLSVTGTLRSGTYSNNISNSGTLSIGTTNQTLSGIISGTGALTKVGGGTLTLRGTNTYAGGTTVSAGSLVLDHLSTGTVLSDSGAVTINGGNLQLNDSTETVGAVTLTSGAIFISTSGNTLTGTSYTFNIGNGLSLFIAAILSGPEATLTKLGAGTLILMSTNTYTGITTILDGTLSVTGTLGSGTYSNNITNSGTLSIGTTTQTLSGIISGTGALTKVGGGTLTLSNTNTYQGITTISGGTLKISSDSNLGNVPASLTAASITFNGGTLNTTGTFAFATNRGITLTGTGTINTDSGTTLTYSGVIAGASTLTKSGLGTATLSGANTYTGATTISTGTLSVTGTLGSGTYSNNISNSGTLSIGTTDQTLSGIISGTGALTKAGDGTLTLSNTNTYQGITTISGGTLKISSDANLGIGPGLTANSITFNGGTLNTTGTFSLLTNRGITLTGAGIINTDSGTTFTYGGVIAGASTFTKSGDGTLTLTGTNTYAGGTTISGGTLTISADRNLGIVPATLIATTFNGGTLNTTGTFTLSTTRNITLTGTGIINTDSGTILTYNGVIAGAGTLTKSGAGTLTLTGANTYAGGTTVSAGTLILDGTGGSIFAVLSDSGAVTVNGGTLQLNDTTETVGAVTLTSGSITVGAFNALTGTSYILNPGDGVSVSVSAVLAGSGVTLTKSGLGTATLSKSNTYTGLTTVSGGTLAYGINNAINTGGITVNGTGAVLSLGTYTDTVGAVTVTEGSITGGGTLTSTSGFTFNPTTEISVSASPILAGSVALTKSGLGTATLSGSNTYSGITTISAGILDITNGRIRSSNSTITVSAGATCIGPDCPTYSTINANSRPAYSQSPIIFLPMPPMQPQIKIFYTAQTTQVEDVNFANTNISTGKIVDTKIVNTQIFGSKNTSNVKINDERIIITQPINNINSSSAVNFVNSKNIKSDFVQGDNTITNKRILTDFFKSDPDSNKKNNDDNTSALSKVNTIFKQSLKSFLNINLEEAE